MMKKFQNEQDFISISESIKTVQGNFFFLDKDGDYLMERDFTEVEFVDCVIQGGDFCGSNFINCTFRNVQFNETALVAVFFKNCIFNYCELKKVDAGFHLENCTAKNLSITGKTE